MFLKDRSAIRPVFFPVYAPDLNPIEYVWGYLKMNHLAYLAAVARCQTRGLQRKPALLRAFP